MSADTFIKEILSKYGEDPREATWKVQGTTVIYHKALERIAAKARIAFKPPTVLRAERDEAVLLVEGSLCAADNKTTGATMHEWSIGEALVGTNYRVSGKQAAYVYAIAEKRAKDRVILKLIGLHGLIYSEDEADDFKPSSDRTIADTLILSLKSARNEVDLKRWYRGNEATIDALPDDLKDEVRAAYSAKLHDLRSAA